MFYVPCSMIKFDIITIFPEIFKSYLGESLIARAQKKKLIKINIHNLRKWTNDSHKTVDDRPFGGGLGMVLKVEPIFKAVKQIKKSPAAAGSRYGGTKVILFTPRGKKFDQKIADMEISIGDYDLMGGELPAMVAIETISRLIPGVLGKPQLLKERITKSGGFIEYAQYTRPPKFFVNLPKFQKKFRGAKKFRRAKPEVWSVPRGLLSGDHKKIEEWKKKHNKIIE